MLIVATSRLCSIIVALVSFIVVACSSSAALSVKFKFWKMPGKYNFNDKWLHLVEYRSWLQKVMENKKAYCVLCMKQIDIAAMVESALKSHASSLKHKDAEKSCTNVSTISTFFSSSGSDANTDRATTSQDTCILTQDSSVQPVMLNSICSGS